MALPININELLNGNTVEWERIEFREGWNPERTLHTICAFANDFNNWSGGYIILGIAEKDGIPILPPIGIELNQIDKIQKELNNICRKIIPNYFPIVEPVNFQNKIILVLWCPGGSVRPYKAPDSLGKKQDYFYFIRRYSSTVKPTRDEERELLGMANQIPFDDRINHFSSLNDFDLSTIKVFLNEIGSELEKEIPNLTIDEIARRMNIAEGGDEYLLPKNVGLLLFARNPQSFFPYAKIEVIIFKDETGITYTEKIFTGPIHIQLKDALNYLKNSIIEEKIIKISGRAEADRFFNYPYQAIEEALANAVYHRGYDNNNTIEVRVFPERLEIISFPGPLLPLDKEKLKNLQFDVRKYRNRRIGEFLKELHLTEGRLTGITTILNELNKNQSPPPVFDTDDERTYFKCTLFISKYFGNIPENIQITLQVREQVNFFVINNLDEILLTYSIYGEQVREQVISQLYSIIDDNKINNFINVLTMCLIPKKREEILKVFGITNLFKNYESHILVMIDNELLERTIPDKPKSPKQKYRTTDKGKKLLNLLTNN
ncbi:MAG: putative DNA binding domain-containing protein [Ignavibacteriales bacterium]|nr:putative DNA binding domain-containing protein [Ignavibacteriales bacterium]